MGEALSTKESLFQKLAVYYSYEEEPLRLLDKRYLWPTNYTNEHSNRLPSKFLLFGEPIEGDYFSYHPIALLPHPDESFLSANAMEGVLRGQSIKDYEIGHFIYKRIITPVEWGKHSSLLKDLALGTYSELPETLELFAINQQDYKKGWQSFQFLKSEVETFTPPYRLCSFAEVMAVWGRFRNDIEKNAELLKSTYTQIGGRAKKIVLPDYSEFDNFFEEVPVYEDCFYFEHDIIEITKEQFSVDLIALHAEQEEHYQESQNSPLYRINQRISSASEVDSNTLNQPYWSIMQARYAVLGYSTALTEDWDWFQEQQRKEQDASMHDWSLSWACQADDFYKMIEAAGRNDEFIIRNKEAIDTPSEWQIDPSNFISWCERKGIALRNQIIESNLGSMYEREDRLIERLSNENSTSEALRSKISEMAERYPEAFITSIEGNRYAIEAIGKEIQLKFSTAEPTSFPDGYLEKSLWRLGEACCYLRNCIIFQTDEERKEVEQDLCRLSTETELDKVWAYHKDRFEENGLDVFYTEARTAGRDGEDGGGFDYENITKIDDSRQWEIKPHKIIAWYHANRIEPELSLELLELIKDAPSKKSYSTQKDMFPDILSFCNKNISSDKNQKQCIEEFLKTEPAAAKWTNVTSIEKAYIRWKNI